MPTTILYIGSFNKKDDEGLSKISNCFFMYFTGNNKVMCINPKQIYDIQILANLYKLKPDIIHYLTGPTIRSLVLLKLLKTIFKESKTIISATRPFFYKRQNKYIKYLKPDFIFTQSEKWEIVFKKYGIKTKYLPNPVNCSKFKKLDIPKNVLRKKYDLPGDKKIGLHVGHIRRNRNVEFLSKLQQNLGPKNIQIVIIGSTHFPADKRLIEKLRKSGCIVINDYIKHITEIYNACDYYIFPVKGLSKNYYPKRYNEIGVIDMPLTILEALACELPVISTRIDSIEKLIKNNNDIPFVVFDGTENSFSKAKNSIEYYVDNYQCQSIRNQINLKKVLNEVESTYTQLSNDG